MAIPAIPVFTGTSPDRNQQSAAAFTINSIEWLDYQLVQIDATNATVEGINLAVIAFDAGVLAAAASAAASASSADDSSTSATVSQSNANFKGRWSDATGAATIPATYSNNGQTWQLLQNIADITADEPLPGATNWQVVNDINMSNVNVSELENPLAHLLKKNKFVETLKGNVSSTRNTIATRVGINNIVRDVAIDDPREEAEGWLFEGDSTNDALQTNNYTDAVWAQPVGTGTLNFVTGASGANAVQTIGSAQRPFITEIITLLAATTYTASAIVESVDDIGDDNAVLFIGFSDVSASVKASEIVDGIISITFTTIDDTTGNLQWGIGAAGNSTGNITMSQIQVEQGTFRTSNIPTDALPVTRSADDQSFPSAENFQESEGAIFLKADVIGDTGGNQVLFEVSDGTNSNRITMRRAGDKIQLLIMEDGVIQTDIKTAFDMNLNIQFEIGINYKDNDVELFVDSVSIGADTSVTMPAGLTIVNLGRSNLGEELFGHMQDLRFYPRRLTLDEIKYLGGI